MVICSFLIRENALMTVKWIMRVYDGRGEMAEWSIAAVLKTAELKGSRGSNPLLSAS